jgi:3-methyladenine DNA glycosylase AlkD
MTPEAAIDALSLTADAAKAAQMAAYHKVPRVYLGVANPEIETCARDWRAALDLPDRIALAAALWDTDIHEARIVAAKLVSTARMQDLDPVAWDLVVSWISQLDGTAIADAVCSAGARRLVADPARLDQVAGWIVADSEWSRRAALAMTLPWTRQNHPNAEEVAARDRVLEWAATLSADPSRAVQQALANWLRELGRHDAPRVHVFLADHGAALKPFTRKEAMHRLPPAAP